MTDFGAEESFARASEKLAEHYGIKMGASAVREKTLRHARAIGGIEHTAPSQPVPTLVSALDGSMVPIVQPGEGKDKRKGKTLFWREARLCCARPEGAVESLYGATLGSSHIAGLVWGQTARAAGFGPKTHVHGLGDGAPWITSVFQEQFGLQGRYTVDFWHVSDYLAKAAAVLAPADNKNWLHEQQGRLLENKVEPVLQLLESGKEAAVSGQEPGPVAKAHRYIQERRDHLDYAGAKAAGLPIGSGEIESGHRHVIQERLKLSGAWWRERTAESMLQLRVVRANKDWGRYWSEFARN